MFEACLPWTSHYFLAAGFALSCLGFRFFLSFFCELLPLPMMGLLGDRG